MKDDVDHASPKKLCQSKTAEQYPTSCTGLEPEYCAANIKIHSQTLVHTNTMHSDAYAHVRTCDDDKPTFYNADYRFWLNLKLRRNTQIAENGELLAFAQKINLILF